MSVADVEKLFQEYGREIWTAKAERLEGTAGITPRLWLCTPQVIGSPKSHTLLKEHVRMLDGARPVTMQKVGGWCSPAGGRS